MRHTLVVLAVILALTLQVYGQIPRTISYQGLLCDATGKPKADNSYQMMFRLYEVETGGTAIWTGQKTVTVTRGLFSAQLGPFDVTLKFNNPCWLGIQVQGESSELSPRIPLSSVGYSLSAVNADTAAYAGNIKDGVVTTAKIAEAAITVGKVAPGQFIKSINTLKDSVTLVAGTNVTITPTSNTLTIAAASGPGGTITEVKPGTGLSGGGMSGSVTLSIANQGVNADQLADGAVSGAKIGSGQVVKSINTVKDDVTLQAGTNVTIGASGNTLTISASGNSGTITGVTPVAPLSGGGTSGNVTISLNDQGVAAAKLADNAVTSAKIADGQIANADISASAAIDPGKISGTAWTYANDGSGTGLDADMVDSKHASEFSAVTHNHLGEVWSDWTTGNGVYLTGNVGWSSGIFRADNANTGPSIWGYNNGGGNAVRGDAFGVGSIGVYGGSESNSGVVGRSTSFRGVEGHGQTGVYGESEGSGTGVTGYCTGATGNGVLGEADNGIDAKGIWGRSTNGWAGYFDGKVRVSGYLTKAGGGFVIDHPLDPANKFLYHSFVESPDMMNIYNGNVTLDAGGEAVVALPDWFGALNKEFRYQLTCIGGFAPVYIADEVSGNRFRIAGGSSGMKVSWQVTGIRQDTYAATHPIQVEVAKAGTESGKYLHPQEFGLAREMGIGAEKAR